MKPMLSLRVPPLVVLVKVRDEPLDEVRSPSSLRVRLIPLEASLPMVEPAVTEMLLFQVQLPLIWEMVPPLRIIEPRPHA